MKGSFTRFDKQRYAPILRGGAALIIIIMMFWFILNNITFPPSPLDFAGMISPMAFYVKHEFLKKLVPASRLYLY